MSTFFTILFIFSSVIYFKTGVPVSDSVITLTNTIQEQCVPNLDSALTIPILDSTVTNRVEGQNVPLTIPNTNQEQYVPFSQQLSMNSIFSASMDPMNPPIMSIIPDIANNPVQISHKIINPTALNSTSIDVAWVSADPVTSTMRILTIADINNIYSLQNYKMPFYPADISNSYVRNFEMKNPHMVHILKKEMLEKEFFSADHQRISTYKFTEFTKKYMYTIKSLNDCYFFTRRHIRLFQEFKFEDSFEIKLSEMAIEDAKYKEFTETVYEKYISQ